MPPAATVALQSPSERVSLQGVPHECAVANEWTAMRVASQPESSFKQTSVKLPRPLSVESSVEPSDKLEPGAERQAAVAIKY